MLRCLWKTKTLTDFVFDLKKVRGTLKKVIIRQLTAGARASAAISGASEEERKLLRMDDDRRILSIQSHVVSGYVGNKSAVFPLQLLGYETDAVNSVQFSNHTGYTGGFRGSRMDDTGLAEILEGLSANRLDGRYTHVITGYVGTPTFLRALAKTVRDLKQKAAEAAGLDGDKINKKVVYVCDPVMGDIDPVGWYVPKSLLPIYKEEIVPLADICIPNEFELALLTDIKVTDESSAVRALRKLNEMGVETAVLSSCCFGQESLSCYASQASSGQVAAISFPRLPVAFVGSGDLFTAMVTAWLDRHKGDIFKALESTVAVMQAVLGRTLDHVGRHCDVAASAPEARLKELRLIQSKADIENPKVTIRAKKIN